MSIEKVKEAVALYQKAETLLRSGPLSYYLEKMTDAYDYLMDNCCPFRIGDRVALIANIDVDAESGWHSSRHFLIQGSIGTIQDRDFIRKEFFFGVSFDDESWIGREGDKNPSPHSHTYCMQASRLRLHREITTTEQP